MAGVDFESFMQGEGPIRWDDPEGGRERGDPICIGDPICMINGVVSPEANQGYRDFRIRVSLGRLVPGIPAFAGLTAARQEFRATAVYDADPTGPADFRRRPGVSYAGFGRDDPGVRVRRLPNGNNVAVHPEGKGTFEDNITFDAVCFPPTQPLNGDDTGFHGLVRAGNWRDRYDLNAPREAVSVLARLLVSEPEDAAWLTDSLLPAGDRY